MQITGLNDQYVEMNHVREKRKPQCKLWYKLFKEEYGYDPSLNIYPFPTSIQLKDFLGRIQQCVTVVGIWISDINFNFVLPLLCDNMDYCSINDSKKKELMVTKKY